MTVVSILQKDQVVTLDDLIREAKKRGAIRIFQHTDLQDRPREEHQVKIIFPVDGGKAQVESANHIDLKDAFFDAIEKADKFNEMNEWYKQ